MADRIKILQAIPVAGKSYKGRALARVLDEILTYDRCTTILIDKVGVDAFVKNLVPLIPPTTVTYCNESCYELQWRRAIWSAAWNAWQDTKTETNK